MKELNKINLCIITLYSIFLLSCKYKFTERDLKYVHPFSKDEKIVFISNKNTYDTIFFKQYKISVYTSKNALEEGIGKSTSLQVRYYFSKNSYHQPSNGQGPNNEFNLINFSASDNSIDFRHIGFIGMWFDEKYIDRLLNNGENEVDFTESNSYENLGFAKNKWLVAFKFSFTKGVVAYTDNDGTQWIRSN
jgi:hypothetical protein